MGSSVVVPITLWSRSHPKFRISCICVTPNFRKLVTGSHSGQVFLWDLNIEKKEVTARALLLGHEYSVTCVACTNDFVITNCEGGEMCRWNLEDGYCEKKKPFTKDSWYVHRNVQLQKRTSDQELLFACGDYAGVLVYHSVTLQLLTHLFSKADYTWISNFSSVFKIENENIIVFGVSCAKNCVKKCVFNNEVNFLEQEITTINLPVDNIIDIKFNEDQSMALIVTMHSWLLLDSELVNLFHQCQSVSSEYLLGGNFSHSDIVIWTVSGSFYVYTKLNNQFQLKTVQVSDSTAINIFKTAVTLARCDTNENIYFLKGDHQGQISIWMIDNSKKKLNVEITQPVLKAKIQDEWKKLEKGFFDDIVKFTSVTCCVFVSLLDKFFLGCLNGEILIVPAMQSLLFRYMCSSSEVPLHYKLSGHSGKVNCLLYPYEKYSHHDKDHLVSGASDFSVCLWDIGKYVLLYRFCVQSGEIQHLLIPPENFHSHVRHSICSVSSDHSVAILNLLDRRCVILTSRHAYPVVSVNWKPLDGFMIVECYDGTVFVWETETGFLDRVLDGVYGQEVLYACQEYSSNMPSSLLLNFYIIERAIRNSMKNSLFAIEFSPQSYHFPVSVCGFQMSDISQSQIWMCHLERLIKNIISHTETEEDCVSDEKFYFLTQASDPEVTTKSFLYFDRLRKKETKRRRNIKGCCEIVGGYTQERCNDLRGMESILRFLLSTLHVWSLDHAMDDLVQNRLGFIKPNPIPSFGIVSSSGTYTLFLPSKVNPHQLSSTLMASTCITMMTLSRILQSLSVYSLNNFCSASSEIEDQEKANPWEKVYSFYESLCSCGPTLFPRPKVEVLANVWRSKCLPIKTIIQKLLPSHLEALVQQDYLDLLKFWYDYLPHFKAYGKTFEKSDIDHTDLKTIALVLFGTVGSDLKFKANFPTCQENYIYQTCSSLVYLLLMPNAEDQILKDLQTMAIDFIGRGYIVWEQFLKVEKIHPILFQMCRNMLKKRFGGLSQAFDKAVAAHNALKAIALSRTSAFIKCLMTEISQPYGSQHRIDNFSIENSKPEVLSIIVFLLEKTPYIMLLHLNDVISIFIYCIDSTHLKQENLSDLLPIMSKFRQVDHSVPGQRIAVGLGTGSIAMHDLRTSRTVVVTGHKDSIAAIKFSDDGKYLVSYCSYENRLIIWQILTGMFGLGQIQIKCYKCYSTPPIHDEEITNHLEVAQLIWSGSKSVMLKLCDGTETVFQT